MRDLSAILADLAEVHGELADEADLGRRAELRARQEALRAEAAQRRAASPPDPEDRAESLARLARLEAARNRHKSAYLSGSAAAQTGMGGGIDPEHVHELHRKMDEAAGLDEIEAEIRSLRAHLAGGDDERGESPSASR